jgi:hypothetical protein
MHSRIIKRYRGSNIQRRQGIVGMANVQTNIGISSFVSDATLQKITLVNSVIAIAKYLLLYTTYMRKAQSDIRQNKA